MRNTLFCVIASAIPVLTYSPQATAGIIAPGFDVQVYAPVTDPVNLTFDSAGNLFVGRDNVGSGGGNSDDVRIHRVGPGGFPVAEYGDSGIFDPDAVVFDALGTIAGTPGSVLVGGGTGSNSMARITAILPDETTSILFTAPPMFFSDINQMVFDGTGRLLIRDDFNIYAMTGPSLSTRTTLLSFDTVRPTGFAVGENDDIFVGLTDGTIQSYSPDGTLINSSVASGLTRPAPLFANGTLFDDGLYALDNGSFFKVGTSGATEIATGIDPRSFANFGTDGALYISEFSNDHVLRMSPVPEPLSLILIGTGLIILFAHARRHRRLVN